MTKHGLDETSVEILQWLDKAVLVGDVSLYGVFLIVTGVRFVKEILR